MFSIFGKNRGDSFEERGRKQQVWRALRRIIDSNTELAHLDNSDGRQFKRYKRHLPVAFVPCHQGEFDGDDTIYGVTRDFCDNGISLIANSNHFHEIGICGFWLDQPLLFSAKVAHWQPFGGNMILAGVELTSVIQCQQTITLLHESLQNLIPVNVLAYCEHCEQS